MGVRESKIVIDNLSEAHSNAQDHGNEKIKLEVKGPFLEALQHLWSNAPESTQKSIRGLSAQPRKRKVPKLAPQAIVDGVDEEKVALWKKTPMSFFKEKESELVLTEKACTEMTDYMTKLSNQKGLNEVRSRLLQVIYYRFKERIGVKKMGRDDVDCLVQIFFESGLRGSKALEQVQDWVDYGNRINHLCLAAGSIQRTGYRHLANLFFCDGIAYRSIKRLPIQNAGDNKEREFLVQRIQQPRNRISHENRQNLEELSDILISTVWDKVEGVMSRSNIGWELRLTQSFQIWDSVPQERAADQPDPNTQRSPQPATVDGHIPHAASTPRTQNEHLSRTSASCYASTGISRAFCDAPSTSNISPTSCNSPPPSSDPGQPVSDSTSWGFDHTTVPRAFPNASGTPQVSLNTTPPSSDPGQLPDSEMQLFDMTSLNLLAQASFHIPSSSIVPPISFNAPPPANDPDQLLDSEMQHFNMSLLDLPTQASFHIPSSSNVPPISFNAPPANDPGQLLDSEMQHFNMTSLDLPIQTSFNAPPQSSDPGLPDSD